MCIHPTSFKRSTLHADCVTSSLSRTVLEIPRWIWSLPCSCWQSSWDTGKRRVLPLGVKGSLMKGWRCTLRQRDGKASRKGWDVKKGWNLRKEDLLQQRCKPPCSLPNSWWNTLKVVPFQGCTGATCVRFGGGTWSEKSITTTSSRNGIRGLRTNITVSQVNKV